MAIFIVLAANGSFSMSLDVYRMVLFNTVSIASTTGYATTDYTQWPIFAPILMLMLSGIATSAGSTGAGIKMARLVILVKQTRREIFKMLHPRAVSPLVINGDMVANKTVFAVLAFMLVYGGTIIALTFLLLLTNLSFDTAFSAIVACVNNAGPGLNEVGPAGNYAGLTDFQVSICSIAMILGRLEMMSFLAVFTVSFWRD
jgi:trk system potassium uptake protein TrkH